MEHQRNSENLSADRHRQSLTWHLHRIGSDRSVGLGCWAVECEKQAFVGTVEYKTA